MSDFSEKCRQYIEDTGTNIYQLSKISGLDRTSLQRMVTGKRLPGPEFISQFCLYLRINPQQRQELIELYELERIGKPTGNAGFFRPLLLSGYFSETSDTTFLCHRGKTSALFGTLFASF